MRQGGSIDRGGAVQAGPEPHREVLNQLLAQVVVDAPALPCPPLPPHRQVLNQLLAQVVVDPVYLVLPQVCLQTPAQLLAARTVLAKRLLDDHTRPASSAVCVCGVCVGGGAGRILDSEICAWMFVCACVCVCGGFGVAGFGDRGV